MTSSPIDAPTAVDAFHQFKSRLEELGYEDKRNIVIEYRSSDGREERFAAIAQELTELPVDVIVVADTRAIPVAKAATSTIPIVMALSPDVVAAGLVESLARPGGNLTGMTDLTYSLNGKRLELLLEAVPGASCIGVLWNAGSPGLRSAVDEIHERARERGLGAVEFSTRTPDEFRSAFDAFLEQGCTGVIVVPDPFVNINASTLVQQARESRLPVIYGVRIQVDAGGLMSYGPSRASMFRRAADYVDRILLGDAPATLPIEQPTVFDLPINLRAADEIGLSVPGALLTQATVILR